MRNNKAMKVVRGYTNSSIVVRLFSANISKLETGSPLSILAFVEIISYQVIGYWCSCTFIPPQVTVCRIYNLLKLIYSKP